MDELKKLLENAGVSESPENNAIPEDQLAQQIAASIWNWTVTSNGEYDSYVSEALREKIDHALFQMQKNANNHEDELSLVPMDDEEQDGSGGLDVGGNPPDDPWGLGK